MSLKRFIANQPVLSIAAVLAVISMFFVKPSKAYIGYIDFRTLALLFCLMLVVAGWQKAGLFRGIASYLLGKISDTRQLVMILVFLCFFSSMLITNDVALITFVPFAVLMLVSAGKKDLLIMTVVLQTVAANLGSMLLPVGNPQNLYLWGISGMPVGEFVKLMLPCWLLSLVLLFAACFLVKKEPIGAKQKSYKVRKISLLYGILFALCLCVVAGWIPYYYAMPLITVVVLIADRHLLRRVDYLLLLTFVCFFIFIGNMKNIQMVSDAIAGLLGGREFLVGFAASQVISNVPAAILLSGFTDQIRTLILATDIGGLGTLIASLASLISYNAYVKVEGADPKRYMVTFTLMNIVFLILLCVFVLTLRIY